MLLRMKQKYFLGKTTAGKYLAGNDPVLPGSQYFEQRRQLKQALQRGEFKEEQYAQKFEEMKKAYNKKKKGKRERVKASAFLQLELKHGDMVVMHGEGLQKYYEVSNMFCLG
jgi:hypothetical protein